MRSPAWRQRGLDADLRDPAKLLLLKENNAEGWQPVQLPLCTNEVITGSTWRHAKFQVSKLGSVENPR